MLILYNLATNQSRIITQLVIPNSEEILLTAEESLDDLINLHAAWLKDLPGTSHALTTLRNDLIRTDWLRRRARNTLQHFQLELYLTLMPPQYWDRLVQHQVRFLEKQSDRAQNEFRKAFQLLQSLKPASAKPEEPAPPPKPQRIFKPYWQQNIRVSRINGKTVTEFEPTPEDYLKPEILNFFGVVWRNFHFRDGVPEEYAWALHHEGVEYPPAPFILITYEPEDFKDICLRELAANSEHLLDGNRSGYSHLLQI